MELSAHDVFPQICREEENRIAYIWLIKPWWRKEMANRKLHMGASESYLMTGLPTGNTS